MSFLIGVMRLILYEFLNIRSFNSNNSEALHMHLEVRVGICKVVSSLSVS